MSDDLWAEWVKVADEIAEAAATYVMKEPGKHTPEGRVGLFFAYMLNLEKIVRAHPRVFKDP